MHALAESMHAGDESRRAKVGPPWSICQARHGARLLLGSHSQPAHRQCGFGITSAAGYFVVGEIGYLVHAENNAPGLPGRYRVGGYYDSNEYVSLSNPGHPQTGN